MSVLNKIGASVFALLLSSYACAEIIDLDAMNADVCRQQILKSTDDAPVIAIYSSTWNDGSPEFIKNLEQLAKENPSRTFFKWDASEDLMHTTQSLCLQQLGFLIFPSLELLLVSKEEHLFLGVRREYAQFMTYDDLEKAIIVPTCDLKQIVLAQKHSR